MLITLIIFSHNNRRLDETSDKAAYQRRHSDSSIIKSPVAENDPTEVSSQLTDSSSAFSEDKLATIAPVSPLMQAIKKDITPDPSVKSEATQDLRFQSSPSGSRKLDSRLVLIYTSTNKFDDSGIAAFIFLVMIIKIISNSAF